MTFRHIVGVDHVMISVRDLGVAARAWAAAGFTLSPRGRHSEYMGTANHTIVFGSDYLELMGVEHPTPLNEPTRTFLRQREGIERAALTTDDAAALAAELQRHGFAGDGPLVFGRPVPLPGGASTEARFQITSWPANEAPAGLHLFACQHLTRTAVWVTGLEQHRNGATGLMRIEIIAADPRATAAHLGRLIGQEPEAAEDALRVRSGAGRAAFDVMTAAAFARRYPEPVRAGAPAQGAAALVLASADPGAADSLPGAIAHDGRISLPAAQLNGVVVSFARAR